MYISNVVADACLVEQVYIDEVRVQKYNYHENPTYWRVFNLNIAITLKLSAKISRFLRITLK